jgi:ribosomal protein L7/L12
MSVVLAALFALAKSMDNVPSVVLMSLLKLLNEEMEHLKRTFSNHEEALKQVQLEADQAKALPPTCLKARLRVSLGCLIYKKTYCIKLLRAANPNLGLCEAKEEVENILAMSGNATDEEMMLTLAYIPPEELFSFFREVNGWQFVHPFQLHF